MRNLSTEGQSVRLCWAHSEPKKPLGSHFSTREDHQMKEIPGRGASNEGNAAQKEHHIQEGLLKRLRRTLPKLMIGSLPRKHAEGLWFVKTIAPLSWSTVILCTGPLV